jgi:predicted nucleotidyltransferase component of viral defense system
MLNINKHKFFLVQVLKDIYSDIYLANHLGFKGGTALALFYDLPRFSVDLDFNLTGSGDAGAVYEKLRLLALKYGGIRDEAKKHFGLIVVLDYGEGERNLKIEISNRQYGDNYEIRNYLGISVKVMRLPDMFAHKLCALLDRRALTNRDIFDCHFLMQRRTPVNKHIVEQRMNLDLASYLDKCIDAVENVNERRILSGLGELMDEETKSFVKNKLKGETISLLKLYREFPITG